MNKLTKLNVAIPEDDHRELKSVAAQQGKTIMEATLEAIRDWVRKQKRPRG